MNNITMILAMLDRAAAAWLPLLLDASVKAAVLIVLVGVAARLFQRASAAARHLVWLIAVAMLAAMPVLVLTLPGWQVLPDLSTIALSQPVRPLPAIDPVTANDATSGATSSTVATSPNTTSPIRTTGSAVSKPPLITHIVTAHWPTLLFGVWAIGCVATITVWLAGTISLWRLRRRATQIDAGPLATLLSQLAAQLQVRQPVRLLSSGERQMPMQWGVVRPRILLPATAATWPQDRLAAVLLHELAHVRRRDCLVQLTATLTAAVYWFHPLVWWAVRRLKAESELACDDAVLTAGCGAADYAEHLLHVAARSSAATLPSAAIAMARQTDLEGRVRAILAQSQPRGPATLVGSAACLVVLAAATISLAALCTEVETIVSSEHTPPAVAGFNPEAPVTQEHPVTLGYVDDTAEGRRSIAGSGHAVRFERPNSNAAANRLVAVEIFASRYGHEEPPAEDFHVYVLDENHQLLHAAPFPYSRIERSAARWYTLKLPAVEVPERFVVALAFNPHRTKGVYLSYDKDVQQSHSLVGRPTTGYEQLGEDRDWMIRTVLAPDAPLANPFESPDED